MVDEHELLKRAKKYDHDALAEIYARYSRTIYDHAYHWTGDRSLAEEVTAEVFLAFLGTIESIDAQTAPLVLLYRITGERIIDARRRQRPSSEAPVEDPERSEPRRAIHRLPADQQQVLILKLGEELSNTDVAKILGTTEDVVKRLVHRALANLWRSKQN